MIEKITLGTPLHEEWQKPYCANLPRGKIVAASMRGRKYKEVNEDRILIQLATQRFAVIDGMGGPGAGWQAAELLCEELSQVSHFNEAEIYDRLTRVQERILIECQPKNAGACFLYFQIQEQVMEYVYAGDVKILILAGHGQGSSIFHESVDHSRVNSLLEQGFITAHEAMFHPQRNIITKAITGTEAVDYTWRKLDLPLTGRIVLASDGLWDNFTAEEVADRVRDKNLNESFNQLFSATLNKMTSSYHDCEGVLKPKGDNLSILMLDLD